MQGQESGTPGESTGAGRPSREGLPLGERLRASKGGQRASREQAHGRKGGFSHYRTGRTQGKDTAAVSSPVKLTT